MRRRTGKITAKVQKRPAPVKKTGGLGVAKKSKFGSSGTATGHASVGKWKKYINIDAKGGMQVDKSAIDKLKAAQKSAAARKPIGKNKSAGGVPGGPESWRNDPNDSRNQPVHPDPSLVEEQNRLRNQANVPPQFMIPQNVHQNNAMQQNYAVSMFNAPPPPSSDGSDYAYGMMDYPPVQPNYDYTPNMPSQSRGGVDWRRPNQNQLGVVTPDEFVNTESTQPEPEEGLLGFFSTLSTEEMIALACGGAGFLLFIIVIIVIIFKLRKKSKRKKKKAHDNERSAWVNRSQSNASNSPPAGFMQHTYRTLPGEKDPDHIARIQARNLPAPPLSYTQSAGVTGITTASGTYMSDDRPSMRHKD